MINMEKGSNVGIEEVNTEEILLSEDPISKVYTFP
jgi:hypothetical protein